MRPPKGRTPGRAAIGRFFRRPAAVAGLIVIAVFTCVAILAPLIAPFDPIATSWSAIRKAPSAAHWMGTDENGRDVLSRVLFGARASLLAGVVSVLIAAGIGVPAGLLAGFAGGAIDAVLSRIVDALLAWDLSALWVALQHLALPAVAMCLSPLATVTRMMRASTLEVLQQDYVLTERALGLSWRLIIGKYVLRNAMSATLTVIGLYVGWLLGGTVLVETVFDWPGIGLYATKAIVSQDFMPVMGVTLAIGVVFVLTNLVVDLCYGLLNPRVRIA